MQYNYTHKLNRIENVTHKIAMLAIAIAEKFTNQNNLIHYSPICWQCGSEQNLLKVHTSNGELFVCSACGGVS